jgi:hypothetical protein
LPERSKHVGSLQRIPVREELAIHVEQPIGRGTP